MVVGGTGGIFDKSFYKKYFPRRQSDIERVILKFQDDKTVR